MKANQTPNSKAIGKEEEIGLESPAVNKKVKEMYIVSSIKGHRGRGKKKEYFIKWKGYSEKDNTWEPLNNLTMISGVIKNYESMLKKQQY